MKRQLKYGFLSGSMLLLLQFIVTKIMGIKMLFSHQVIIYVFILVATNSIIFYLLRDKENVKPSHSGRGHPKDTAVNVKKKLEKIRESMLLAISNNPNLIDAEVAVLLSIGIDVVKFHLEELRKIKFLKVIHIQGSTWENIPYREEWLTEHLGQKYLVRHKLIK